MIKRTATIALIAATTGLVAGCQTLTPRTDTAQVQEQELRFRGELTASSPLNQKDGSRYSRHRLRLEEGTLVQFEQRGALRGELALYGTDGLLVANSQDSYSDAGPSLSWRVATGGTHTLVVSGQDADSYGPFEVVGRYIALGDDRTLQVGEPLQGWFGGQPLTYELRVAEDALVTIDMTSPDFDTYLELSGAGVAAQDDDSGGELNSQIRRHLPAGQYTVTARSYDSGSGLFELSVDTSEMSSTPAGGPLTLGTTLESWLGTGEQEEYVFDVERSGRYRLEMTSPDLDAFLEIVGNGVSLSDDDGAGGLDARVEAELTPGTYRVTARTYDGSGSGNYWLSVAAD